MSCIHSNMMCPDVQAEVKANKTAVVGYRPDGAEPASLTIPYLFSGESVSLRQAYLVWLPFSLPDTEVIGSHAMNSHMTIM